MMQRRINDLQTKEAEYLSQQQKLIAEKDALKFQMEGFKADLNTQKSTSVIQLQRFEQETGELKDKYQRVCA